ncbi:hypothetical protein BC834DRAFT_608249 [Gloeopeniophorella convolvens]|nr:hypothetical protein BC834DRAFT_608249 [Gloeopeniophorella convolvens]
MSAAPLPWTTTVILTSRLTRCQLPLRDRACTAPASTPHAVARCAEPLLRSNERGPTSMTEDGVPVTTFDSPPPPLCDRARGIQRAGERSIGPLWLRRFRGRSPHRFTTGASLRARRRLYRHRPVPTWCPTGALYCASSLQARRRYVAAHTPFGSVATRPVLRACRPQSPDNQGRRAAIGHARAAQRTQHTAARRLAW